MSRLVAVSNRISVPKRGAVPGGLAVGLLAAMQARRGMWFGWDGETSEVAAEEPSVVRKEGVTFASIDLLPSRTYVMVSSATCDSASSVAS